ncbi:hypothetical protein Dimus_028088 [Dionaea muscipula]
MHANTDSEGTSLPGSSPTRSPPRRPVYYVQSPSRDSHDVLLHPILRLPQARISQDLPNDPAASRTNAGSGGGVGGGRKERKPWKDCDVIEEEGLLEDEEAEKPLPRRCYFLAFLLGFFVLFSFFSLILWAAARPEKPSITMKSISFERFVLSAGSDSTGVATEMASVNSTVKFLYRNTATFFGVHVTATPLDLSFSQLTLASGNVKQFYQNRKSGRTVMVPIIGDKIPLYGSGSTLVSAATGAPTAPVPLTLSFMVRSRAYVLGRLVKPKFYRRIVCWITLDPLKLTAPISLKNSCTYS